MFTDLEQARLILTGENCTCVLCKKGNLYKSTQRGVKPLLEFLDSGADFSGFSAADKVVGKATAFLYCLLKVKVVYAPVMSVSALHILRLHHIHAEYETLTRAILNHKKDGFCPMETATREISDPSDALAAIRQTLEKLKAAR